MSTDQQSENLNRCDNKVAPSIFAFLRERSRFTGPELHQYVSERHSVAPGTADRVLRLMRCKGLISYVVTDRSKSQYAVINIK
jgi:hypothetical protein